MYIMRKQLLKLIKNVVKYMIPHGMISYRRKKMTEYRKKSLKRQYPIIDVIENYFLSLNRDEQNIEIIEIIDYIYKNGFSIFPYEYINRYNTSADKCIYDIKCKMHFISHNGKKLYFPKGYSIDMICGAYNNLRIEQDIASPHRYEEKNYIVQEGDIIADIGAAEGIWALNYVENASLVYLFECQNMWIEALQKTFEPWKEKVIIVNKYVSDVNCTEKMESVTLDEYFEDKKINFIKADVEGGEISLLKGASLILKRTDKLSLILCTYHRHDDAKALKEILENNGFETEYSNRYMLFIFDKEIREPYIRRGLIRARKNY